MSPEQAMGERTIDARSDVYALGAVAYQMLAGEPPFTGPSIQAIVARLLSEEPRALAAQRKAVPEAVDAAVLRALEKLPADRFASAAEFAAALDAPGVAATRATRSARATGAPSHGHASRTIAVVSGVVAAGANDRLYFSSSHEEEMVIVGATARAGGTLEPLTRLDSASGESAHLDPSFLPGRTKLLLQVAYLNGQRRIGVADVASGRITPLVDGIRARYVPGGWLLFTTGEARLFVVPFDAERGAITGEPVQVAERLPDSVIGAVDFDISANGTLVYSEEVSGEQRELVWVSRSGVRTPFDSTCRGELRTPALSRDGRRVAVAVAHERQFDIWLRDVAGSDPVRLAGEIRQSSAEPAWSGDGAWVSRLVSRSGNTGDVWRHRLDGTRRDELVLRGVRPISEQDWSPVENRLFVRTTTPTAGSGDILAIRPGEESAPVPIQATPRNEYSPAVSPDGRRLAFAANHTGRLEIYVVPVANPDSARWMVSTNGGTTPRWSRAGDELFFLDRRSNLVAARITSSPGFALQGTRVLFSANDFIQTSTSRHNYDVAPDGQRFLFIQRAGGARNGQMVVIENWASELGGRRER